MWDDFEGEDGAEAQQLPPAYHPLRLQAMTQPSPLTRYANRIIYSHHYKQFYLYMTIFSCLAFISSILLSFNRYPPFVPHPFICRAIILVTVELVLSVMMMAEIMIRMLAMQSAFFKSPGNWFDLLMASLVAVMTLVEVAFRVGSGVWWEAEAAVLLVVRNAVQAVRVWRLVDRTKRIKGPEPIRMDTFFVKT